MNFKKGYFKLLSPSAITFIFLCLFFFLRLNFSHDLTLLIAWLTCEKSKNTIAVWRVLLVGGEASWVCGRRDSSNTVLRICSSGFLCLLLFRSNSRDVTRSLKSLSSGKIWRISGPTSPVRLSGFKSQFKLAAVEQTSGAIYSLQGSGCAKPPVAQPDASAGISQPWAGSTDPPCSLQH